MLFRVQFQGKCHFPQSTHTALYLHLMINDYVLYANKFVPNMAERYKYIVGQTDDGYSDHIGGVHLDSYSAGTRICAFSDIIYLNSGLHVFEVGVRGARTSTYPIYAYYGVFNN